MKNTSAYNATCARMIQNCYRNGSLFYDHWYDQWVYIDPFSNEKHFFPSFLKFVHFYIAYMGGNQNA